MDQPTEDDIIQVYNQIKSWVDKTDEPNASNIIVLVTLLIKCVENIFGDKSGSYKKNLVLKVLQKVINESKLTDNAKASLLDLVNTTIPVVIDTMINIANKQVDINKGDNKSPGCFCC
jgi:hypothetical protein